MKTNIFEHKKVILLISVLVLVSFILCSTTAFLIYRKAQADLFNRLTDIVNHDKSVINALIINYGANESDIVSHFNNILNGDYNAIGDKGEIVFARLVNDSIEFIISKQSINRKYLVSNNIPLATPMKMALKGHNGHVRAKDYNGEMVYAAFDYIEQLKWGIVVKIPTKEFDNHYINTVLIILILTVILISISSYIFYKVTFEIVTNLRDKNIEVEETTQKLTLTEKRLQFALGSSNIGAWDLDLINHSATRNLEHDRIFGYETLLPEWTYEIFLSHVVESDKNQVDAKFQLSLSEKTNWDFECRIKRKDGEIRWIWASGQQVFDRNGNIYRMAGIVQDITKRKETELLIHQNAARVKTLYDLSQMSHLETSEIYDFALEKSVEICNSKIGFLGFLNPEETIVTIYAWSAPVMKSCEVKNRYIEFEVEKTGIWGEVIRQRKPLIINDYKAPNPLKRGIPDGHVEIENYMSVPVFDNNKIVAVIAVGNKNGDYLDTDLQELTVLIEGAWNIIKQKKVEKELFEAKEKAEESEEKLRYLFENTKQGIVFHCSSGEIIMANEAAANILGVTLDQLLGNTSMDPRWRSVHEDFSDYPGDTHPAIITFKTGKPVLNSKMGVFDYLNNDYKWININSIPRFKNHSPLPHQVIVTFEDITAIEKAKHDLERANQIIEKSERQFRQLFENMEQGFALHKMIYDDIGQPFDYQFVIANKAFEKLTGLKSENFINKTARQILPKIEKDWITNYAKVAETGIPLHFDNFSQDIGKYYDVIAYSPQKGYFAVVFTDITKNKEYEKQLIIAKEKAEESEEDLMQKNQEYEAINEELKQTNEELAITKERVEESENRLKRKLDHILNPSVPASGMNIGEIIDIEFIQQIQDAFAGLHGISSVITDINGHPVTNPSNFTSLCRLIRSTPKGQSVCVLMDRELGIMVAEKQKPVIIECKISGLLHAATPLLVAHKIVGFWHIGQCNSGKVTEKSISNLALEIDIDAEQLITEFRKIENKRIENQKFEEIVNLLSLLAQELSRLAFNNVILAKNIEERKEFESKLEMAKNKAEESDRLKSSFLQNMSHEVRTPLNAIVGFSQQIAKAEIEPPKMQFFSKIITESSKKLINIITDVIEISQVHTNQLRPYSSEFDFIPLITKTVSEFEGKALEKSIELVFLQNIPQKELIISSDREKIDRILFHLIDNAIKFTQKGYIEILTQIKDNYLQISVADSGIGIPESMKNAIFEPFRQVEMGATRNYGGNGLGLALVKAYIYLLKGKISIQSEVNSGTTFTVEIPVSKTSIQIKKPEAGYLGSSIKTILIAEDEYSNYQYLLELLDDNFFNIIHASNGMQAIEMCKNDTKIDLILMDIKMPIMDGYTAAKLIKEFRPEVPIVAQTAFALPSEIELFRSVFDDYITKPIFKAILHEKISRFLLKSIANA